ncbi:MAG: SPOR domain-containing protein [Flavobacteriaceae bacterium]
MAIANYIKELLYRYDCVIVPNFGGFVTNRISAQIDPNSNTFYPPSKQLGFNHHLTHNDGLLANYIASSENLSFEQANTKISEIVTGWNSVVKTSALTIDEVGTFSLNAESQLIFEPFNHVNYLTASFGLASFESSSIERSTEKVIPLIPAAQKKKGIPGFVKYAAAIAVFAVLGYGALNDYSKKQQYEGFLKQEEALNKKIQSATFVIDNPLPTIELNVGKDIAKPYHVVAGSFLHKENAQKKVDQLKSKGFDAYVLGKNERGLTQVAYASFYKTSDAYKSLASVRKTTSKDAWLLVKKFY